MGKTKKEGSKTLQKSAIIKVGSENEEILKCSVLGGSNVLVYYGSLFSLKKSQISLLNDKGNVIP